MSTTQTILQIDGGQEIELTNAPTEDIVDRIATALRDGTLLRLAVPGGTLLLNGRTASTVVVTTRNLSGAEEING